MIYLQKSKRRNRRNFVPIVVITLFLVVSTLLTIYAPAPVGGALRVVGLPFWHVKNFFAERNSNVYGFFRTKNSLISENDNLRGELGSLREKLIAYDALSSEHSKLLGEFGRSTTTRRVLATVLSRPPQSPYDVLILDIGSRDTVSVGDIIYGSGGIAMGVVSETSGRTSKADLFSKTGLETQAIVERTGLAITLRGLGGGSFEVQVPQEADIMENDTVIMPALETIMIGQVVEVESVVTSAFKRVLIQAPINISYVRFVFVEPKN